MNENQFLTYQKYTDKALASELVELLTKNNIEFLFEDTSDSFDPSFAFNQFNKEYRLKLKKTDFELADKLQIELSDNHLNEIDRDYYLFDFTNQELIEILNKVDEWSLYDYTLAQQILKERGNEINKEQVEFLRKQRIDELAKPVESKKIWINLGYIIAILGGLIGVFFGWHLHYHKKTLPNGERVYGYSTKDRIHGKNILVLGIIFFIIWTILSILTQNISLYSVLSY